MSQIIMGVIMGNRGFFSSELCKDARKRILSVLEASGVKPIILSPEEGVYGSVESRKDAVKSAELFKKHREEIKGIIVTLPNFSDEKGIAETLRLSGLQVPVLVHAFPDDMEKLDYENRRDSFCGKISVCNNLKQYGIKFSLTQLHNEEPESTEFKRDLEKFKGVCRVVDTLQGARVGVIGPRPADFNTVRYSEKLLQNNDITVEPTGVIDIIGQVKEVKEDIIEKRLQEIKDYINTDCVPEESMDKIAAFYEVVKNWIEKNDLDSIAVQCWDSLQKHLGINPCTAMSMLSSSLLPASCEADVAGAVSMLALQAASQQPSALVDWNNNFGSEPDKCLLFHCGNYAKEVYSSCRMNFAEVLGSTLGEENTYGAIYGLMKTGKITFARISTDDNNGKIKTYLAEGSLIDQELPDTGSWGAVEIKGLQDLMKYLCRNGFEHHVAINLSSTADILAEAFENYLGWEVYNHSD